LGDNPPSAQGPAGSRRNGLFTYLLENPFPLFRMML
jgi:hypothetical protein